MVKKRKASYRKPPRTIDLALNREGMPEEVSEEKVEPTVKEIEPEMEAEKPDTLDQVDDQIPEIQPEKKENSPVSEETPLTPMEEEEEEEIGAGTGLPIPQNEVRFQEPVVKPVVTHVAPRATVASPPKPQPPSNTLRYVVMVGGILLVLAILYLLIFSGVEERIPGPTIVEVTEVKKEEKKSETNNTANNKMSSPRIIFGDLRRNPSLVVAPPVQQ